MKKGMNKKAQFFLLAAVIIAAIVISLGVVSNEAKVTVEPKDFYDYSFSVKTEAGSVIDVQIIQGTSGNLENFVGLLARDLRDKDSEINFVFIYGNNTNLVIENYGDEEIISQLSGDTSEGAKTILGENTKIKSVIRQGATATPQNYTLGYASEDAWRKIYNDLDIGDGIIITIGEGDYEYGFKVSRHNQIIFIVEKQGEGDERYISFK